MGTGPVPAHRSGRAGRGGVLAAARPPPRSSSPGHRSPPAPPPCRGRNAPRSTSPPPARPRRRPLVPAVPRTPARRRPARPAAAARHRPRLARLPRPRRPAAAPRTGPPARREPALCRARPLNAPRPAAVPARPGRARRDRDGSGGAPRTAVEEAEGAEEAGEEGTGRPVSAVSVPLVTRRAGGCWNRAWRSPVRAGCRCARPWRPRPPGRPATDRISATGSRHVPAEQDNRAARTTQPWEDPSP